MLESEGANETEHDRSVATAAGNVRTGRARMMGKIGAVSISKTGPGGPRDQAAVAALAIAALRQKSFDHAKGVIVSFRPFTLTRTGNV